MYNCGIALELKSKQSRHVAIYKIRTALARVSMVGAFTLNP